MKSGKESRGMNMDFRYAVTRRPSVKIDEGIRSDSDVEPIFKASSKQHERYVTVLENCGLEVTVLEGDEDFPDSVFVEDTAVLTDEVAVICNLGIASRRGEEGSIMGYLDRCYENIQRVVSPGTIEGGDVLRIEDSFYVGLSQRTNEEGIEQFKEIVEEYDYTVKDVRLHEMLHLKTGIAYLDDDIIVAAGEMKKKEEFSDFETIEVPDDEAYAANCICVNGIVILPEGYPKTKSLVEGRGFKTISVDVSEFKKLDGGISCLSLRF